jgi:TPR repeat protein
MSRATSLLSDGNIAAARLFFERASEEGMAEGALALGGTYDERELATMKALGLKPDPRLARRWYERARELGSRDAEARLSRLGPAR